MELIAYLLHSIDDSKASTKDIDVNIPGFKIVTHLTVDMSQLKQMSSKLP